MAGGITGQSTTFDLPNYVGELYNVTPQDTKLLSAIGGLTGGEGTTSTLFGWQEEDLRSPEENRQRLEGAAAPDGEARVRNNVTNVVEIHHEAVETSYTKQGATGQFATTGGQANQVGIAGSNPAVSEHARQTRNALVQIARDVEVTFINGTFQNPADNTTPRKTRGLIQACTSNVADGGTLVSGGTSAIATNGTVTAAANGLSDNDTVVARAVTGGAIGVIRPEQVYYVVNSAAGTFQIALTEGGAAITLATAGTASFYTTAELTKGLLMDLMQSVYDNGGIMESDTATLMCGSSLKRALTYLLVTQANYQEQSRRIAGVNVTTLETDFGVLNIMLNRHVPSGALLVLSLEELTPVHLTIPGKGHMFVEPLAKLGSADRDQMYGEIGLKYGNERKHGKVVAVTKPAAA